MSIGRGIYMIGVCMSDGDRWHAIVDRLWNTAYDRDIGDDSGPGERYMRTRGLFRLLYMLSPAYERVGIHA